MCARARVALAFSLCARLAAHRRSHLAALPKLVLVNQKKTTQLASPWEEPTAMAEKPKPPPPGKMGTSFFASLLGGKRNEEPDEDPSEDPEPEPVLRYTHCQLTPPFLLSAARDLLECSRLRKRA